MVERVWWERKSLTGAASGQTPRAISFTKKERVMGEGQGRIIWGRECVRLYACVRERGRDGGGDKVGRGRGEVGEIGPRGENVDDFALRMTSSRCLCLMQ